MGFRVATYNIFDLNPAFVNASDAKTPCSKIEENVQEIAADILCLQGVPSIDFCSFLHNDGYETLHDRGVAICFLKRRYTIKKNEISADFLDLLDLVTQKTIRVVNGYLENNQKHLSFDRIDFWILVGNAESDGGIWSKNCEDEVLMRKAVISIPHKSNHRPVATDFIFASTVLKHFEKLEKMHSIKESRVKILSNLVKSENSFEKLYHLFRKELENCESRPFDSLRLVKAYEDAFNPKMYIDVPTPVINNSTPSIPKKSCWESILNVFFAIGRFLKLLIGIT